jgi:hypothetical protein
MENRIMKNCMFKCLGDDTCGRSTSSHHCQVVNNAICSICDGYTDSLELSTEQKLKNSIKKALEVLPSSIDNREGREMLYKALRI